MSNIVALVPQPRSRLRFEAQAASVLLFTGVFRERYEDWSELSLARRDAVQTPRRRRASATPPAETVAKSMNTSSSDPSNKRAARKAPSSDEAEAVRGQAPTRRAAALQNGSRTPAGPARIGSAQARKPAGASARPSARGADGETTRGGDDPVIAAIIAKIAAQAIANAERVGKAVRRRSPVNAAETPRSRRGKPD